MKYEIKIVDKMNGKPYPLGGGKNLNIFSENNKKWIQAYQILENDKQEPIFPAISSWGIIE